MGARWDEPLLSYSGGSLQDLSTGLGVGHRAVGVPYYWSTLPDFAQDCVRRLQLILRDTDDV
ncbi:hypothetical protein AHiyo4_20210 [Arthrobacter sp. Hiyo4]|nr:hypothetical protein AHiyo4_20210 [Arthrobacter sp. Hiyo4]